MTTASGSDDFKDCSEIRPGMKREFSRMMNQSQFIDSVGRTRSSRSPINANTYNIIDKKLKSSRKSVVADEKPVRVEAMSEEEEPKSGIVDLISDDEKKSVLEGESKVLDDSKVDLEGFKVENVGKEVSDVCVDVKSVCKEGGGDSGEVVSDNTYSLRRVTRSISKPVAEAVKEEVAESNMVDMSSVAVKFEDKMVEKAVVDKRPTKLKELLDTGLLEGLAVRYMRGSKVRGPMDNGLYGIIKGDGILCYCDACSGSTIVTPNQFEVHAGSANKRPPEYIYLENGKTLRDVLNAYKDVPLESVTVTIQNAIASSSSSTEKSLVCQYCKGVLPDSGDCRRKLLCVSCMDMKELQLSSPQQSDTADSGKSSDYKTTGNLSRSKGKGRLTRKDLRMHKKGFEELVDGAEVAYFAGGKKLLEGFKKGSGIFCFCCKKEVSPSQFEAHAGYASRRKPYLHIYTSNGVSLHEWAVKSSLNREYSAAENDDLCSICADGGNLLCCDTCPRAFHTECLSLPVIPEGKFHCRYCKNTFEKEKFVERNANALAAGRVAGVDPIEQINTRCIRIVGTPATDIGGCVLCRRHNFSKSVFDEGTVMICDQCEGEYHIGCLKEHNIDDLKELPVGKWFCGTKCSNIHTALENIIAGGEAKLSDSLTSVIEKRHEEKGRQGCGDLDIKWRLLSGKIASDETRVLLSSAVAIFHEQFDPIADSNTRQLDFIPHMVYGRKLREQDFGGMYCAVLTVNSSVVSAGLFRIFGQEVAELPLVATGSNFQGLGYFQSLFSCIESLLGSLGVKDLVLPSADEAKSIWTNKFGFGVIDPEQLNIYRKRHQMMVFEGTSMLHKPVCQG